MKYRKLRNNALKKSDIELQILTVFFNNLFYL